MEIQYFIILLGLLIGNIALSWKNKVCIKRLEEKMHYEDRLQVLEDLVNKNKI